MDKAKLEVDSELLVLLEQAAQAQSLSVAECLEQLSVSNYFVHNLRDTSYLQRMESIAEEGRKRYGIDKFPPSREETNDRDYARALHYLEYRKRLMKDITNLLSSSTPKT